ncbi:MAG TPA: MAPEG family protein, partial [Gammaproteobacteria bacterium]|nr:MAPEG family protein [Gammaproteobacteria bacterium]
PIALILMLFLEMHGSAPWFLHVAGVTLIVGRLLHAYGLMQSSALTPGRLAGTSLTWLLIVVLALDNLVHLV